MMTTQSEYIKNQIILTDKELADRRSKLRVSLYTNMFGKHKNFVKDVTQEDQIPFEIAKDNSSELIPVRELVDREEEERFTHAQKYAIQYLKKELDDYEKSWKKTYTSRTYNAALIDGDAPGQVSQDTDTVYSWCIQLQELVNKLESLSPEEANKELPITPKNHVEVPLQDGHLFPITFVAKATNKLIDYNNQLSNFIAEVEAYEKRIQIAIKKGPQKINVSWIAKMVEKFCKRLNYWLAWLRYAIIKGLSGVYKGFQKAVKPLDALITLGQKLVNFIDNLSLDTVVSAVKAVLDFLIELFKFLNKPIALLAEFIADATTYGKPLVDETIDLVSNVNKAMDYGLSLKDTIDIAVSDTLNTELLDPKVVKRLEERYVDTGEVNLSIRFEAISLEDILTGNVQKPRWEDYK